MPCLQQNSMITAYGVTVRDVNSTLVSSHQQDVDMTSYSETGLHSDREYSFEVYAIGNSDSGNLHSPSVRIMATTAEGKSIAHALVCNSLLSPSINRLHPPPPSLSPPPPSPTLLSLLLPYPSFLLHHLPSSFILSPPSLIPFPMALSPFIYRIRPRCYF